MSEKAPADPFDITGRRILITGASSGIGRYCALMLAARGASLILGARRRALLEEVATQTPRTTHSTEVICLDVTDPASAEAAVAEAFRPAPVDVLINNAGAVAAHAAADQSHVDFDETISVNLRGSWLMAQAAARHWIAAGRRGVIVNVASILGLRVANHVASYAIAKAGIIQMTKALALEWARYGIRVNALAPGYVETALNADFFATRAGGDLVQRIPQRRLVQFDDLDGPLLLLASDASRAMTGTVIAVDGGHLVSGL